MKKYTSHSLEETADIAQEILNSLEQATTNAHEATIVGLSGHLGAGKTAFTKAVARHLGVTEEITSPTFVIMKIYPLTGGFWKKLIHIDAYRLESGKEFEVIGFEKLVADKDNLIMIEWPENVDEALKGLEHYTRLQFSAGEAETERVIVRE